MKASIRIASLAIMTLVTTAGLGAAQQTLRISTHHSSTSPEIEQVVKPFKEFIEKESGGSIEVRVFPNAVLHKPAEGFKALASGVTDIAPAYPTFQSRAFTLNYASSLPMAFANNYIGGRVNEELYADFYRDEWKPFRILPLFYPVSGTFDLLSTKPITTLADIQKLKIRTGGQSQSEIIEKIGATPVVISSAETYSAFQQGVVDAVLLGPANIISFKVDEIGKYYVPLSLTRVGILWAISEATYDSLSPEHRDILFRASRLAGVNYADFYENETERALDQMRDEGIEFVELSQDDKDKIASLLQPMWDDFIASDEKAGDLVTALRSKADQYSGLTSEGFRDLQLNDPVMGMMPSASN